MVGRRGAMALATALCLLSACKDEPDFDERYEAAEETIRDKAKEIDSTLATSERDRRGPPASEQPAGSASEE